MTAHQVPYFHGSSLLGAMTDPVLIRSFSLFMFHFCWCGVDPPFPAQCLKDTATPTVIPWLSGNGLCVIVILTCLKQVHDRRQFTQGLFSFL